MKNNNLLGTLALTFGLVGCGAATLTDAVDGAIDDAISGVTFPDSLKGKTFTTDCRIGDGPANTRTFIFSDQAVVFTQNIYLAADCSGAVDIFWSSSHVLAAVEEDVSLDGEVRPAVRITTLQGNSYTTPLSAAGVAAGNDLSTVDEEMSGSLCNLTGWTLNEPQDTSGMSEESTGSACFEAGALASTQYNLIVLDDGAIYSSRFSSEADDAETIGDVDTDEGYNEVE